MIIKNYRDLTDDEFEKLFEPIQEIEKEYLINIAENYIAHGIAIRYKNNCLLSEKFEIILNGMINVFNNVSIKDINIDNIIDVLKKEYNLNVINYNPIEIVEL